jgi:hypothetical protein
MHCLLVRESLLEGDERVRVRLECVDLRAARREHRCHSACVGATVESDLARANVAEDATEAARYCGRTGEPFANAAAEGRGLG